MLRKTTVSQQPEGAKWPSVSLPAGRQPIFTSRRAPATRSSSIAATPRPLQPFKLERFFAKYEFCTDHLLCCSDCEPLSLQELLGMADDDSLAMWNSLALGYTESLGLPALRSEVAAMYEAVEQEEVLCAAPEELIYLSMLALLKPGDVVVVTFPGYQSLYEIAESLGCVVRYWEPSPSEDSGELAFHVTGKEGALDTLMQEGPPPKLLVCNFPHNPTGKTLTAAQWEQTVAMCEASNTVLFSDEMYRLLEHRPEDRLPSAVEVSPSAIALSGVSKTIGLPGVRTGWLVTHNEAFLSRVAELKDYTTICGSAPSEVLALMGIRAREQLVRRNLELIQENTALFGKVFDANQDILFWDPPAAGSIAFPRFLGEPVDVDEICDSLVEGFGVLLLPGTVYGSELCSKEARFRVGLGRAAQETGVELLGQFLSERPWLHRQAQQ